MHIRSFQSGLVTSLLLSAIAIIIAIVFEWRVHKQPLDTLLSEPAIAVALPDLAEYITPIQMNYSAIKLRPLFYSSREFYVAPPPATMVPPRPRPNYLLSATMQAPNKEMVALLVQQETHVMQKITTGMDLEGWSVRSITANRVVLQLDNETIEITQSQNQARTAKNGLIVRALSRNENGYAIVGVRQLGSSAGQIAVAGKPATLINRPRLYRPPPN